MEKVAVLRYQGDLRQSLCDCINLIGGFDDLSSPVLVKPNICTIADGTGYTVTDPMIVEALVSLIYQENSDFTIKIIESDSQSKYADDAFEKFGYVDMKKRWTNEGYDIELVNLSKSEMIPLEFEGRYFKNPRLPKEIVAKNSYLSVAVPKTHYLTLITASLKNQFGLLPEKEQASFHSEIVDIIIDFNRIVQPQLCIIDARVGLEGWNGPTMRKLNAILVGRRPVSTDAVTARLMGLEPNSIRHIVEASNYKLGIMDPEIVGESLEALIMRFNEPKNLHRDALIS